MLDKIIYKSQFELVLIFTHRPPMTIYCSNGQALNLLDQLLAPRDNLQAKTLSEWTHKMNVSNQDTQEIELDLYKNIV